VGAGVRVLRISVPEDLGIDEAEARLILAIGLFREGRLTIKQAAELTGLYLEDFMRELSKRKASIINIDVEELREDLRVAEALAK